MRGLVNRIKLIFSNISLKRKILTIVLVSIFLISGVSLAGISVVSDAYLKLLQKTIANNLSYSATTISTTYPTLKPCRLMLSDSNIQSNLSDVRHSDNPRIRTEAYKKLSYTVLEYYHSTSLILSAILPSIILSLSPIQTFSAPAKHRRRLSAVSLTQL